MEAVGSGIHEFDTGPLMFLFLLFMHFLHTSSTKVRTVPMIERIFWLFNLKMAKIPCHATLEYNIMNIMWKE
jgi:hypothetical protein